MNVQKKSHKKLILIIVAIACILCAALTTVILVRGNSKAKKLEKQLELGEKYLDELEYERAIAAYEEAIEIESNCVDAYLAMAEIYVEMDDYESALEVLEDGYDATESEDIEDMLDEIEDMPEEEDEPKLPKDSDTPGEQEPSTVPDSNVENPDLNNDISGVIPDVVQDIIADDIHSIWFDGIEFKILKYLDEDKMLVKFPLNNYLVQAVVPRALEDEEYIDEYCSESDLSGDNREVYLKLKDKDKQDAISFAYMQGPDAITSMKAEYEAKYAQIDGETIYEVSTLNNGRGLVMRINDYITLSEYDRDEKWLPGYMLIVINEEEQMAFAMEILEENESEIDRSYFEQVTFRKIEDTDYVMRASSEQPDYDARMDAMYQKYEEIIKNPDKILQEQYGAWGQSYTLHFLWDFNEDNIPEIVFLGNPRSIIIIGEKNAVSINGSNVIFSNTPNIIYTPVEFTGNVNWSKNEVQVDAQGNLVVNTLENLEGDPAYATYRYMGENISEERYLELLSAIERPDRPKPRMFDTDEYVASKTGFRRSVQCLTNDYVYNLY